MPGTLPTEVGEDVTVSSFLAIVDNIEKPLLMVAVIHLCISVDILRLL
jgi:hypothetical protein